MMIILYLHFMGFVSSFSILILKTAFFSSIFTIWSISQCISTSKQCITHYPTNSYLSILIRAPFVTLQCYICFVEFCLSFLWVLLGITKNVPSPFVLMADWVGKIFFRIFGIWFCYVGFVAVK